MKKYYKIYSRCVNTTRRIIQLTKEEAYQIIDNEVFDNEDYFINVKWEWVFEGPDDEPSDITQECMDSFFSHVCTRLHELFDEMSYIDCGDYRVVVLDEDEEPCVQDSCGTSMASWI